MAKLGGAKGFWDILKSVSVAEIAKEANRPVSLALVGSPERREEALEMLFADTTQGQVETKTRALPATPFVQAFDTMSEESGFPQEPNVFDLVIDLGGGRQDAPEGALVYSVSELGGWESALDRILEDRPDLMLPLARNFPVFRRRVGQQIITQTAVANAQFSLLTGITQAIPITAILLPVNNLSDIVILTKNQAIMALRLAAAYGLTVDYKSRMKEVAPILANAFGWRAMARQVVGAVPFIGFVPRAMIAYAGTITVGKAAQVYYETGETVTKAQAKKLYLEAYEASREKVRALADAIRGHRGGGGGGGGRRRIAASNGSKETPALEPTRDLEATLEPIEAVEKAEAKSE